MRHSGEMAEWSNAAVLKTVEGHTSGGSNPSFSAKETHNDFVMGFVFLVTSKVCFRKLLKMQNQQSSALCRFYDCSGIPSGIIENNPSFSVITFNIYSHFNDKLPLPIGHRTHIPIAKKAAIIPKH